MQRWKLVQCKLHIISLQPVELSWCLLLHSHFAPDSILVVGFLYARLFLKLLVSWQIEAPFSPRSLLVLFSQHPSSTLGGGISSWKGTYMVRSIVLSAALAFGLATAANARVVSAPLGNTDSLVVKVAEGCGPGWWRGPGGRCHPMFNGRACPRGYHLGPERRRCWPN